MALGLLGFTAAAAPASAQSGAALNADVATRTSLAAEPSVRAVDVDAIVRYEVSSVSRNGVWRREMWQEKVVRRGDRLWIERLVPVSLAQAQANPNAASFDRSTPKPAAAGAPGHRHDGATRTDEHADHDEGVHLGHKHFNYDRSARYIQRLPDGKLQVQFVDVRRKMVVDVPAAEFSTVSFTPDWEANANLIAPKAVARMATEASKDGGAPWRVEKVEGWSHRLRWSDKLQMPARIESTSADGRVVRVVTTTAATTTPAGKLPWDQLADFSKNQYDDFTD